MMKCQYCGGTLSLNDEKCPHCGKPNEQAQKHIDDMKRYQGEFTSTKKDVYHVANNYAGIMVRAVIICVLLILIVVSGIVNNEAYSIKHSIVEAKSLANREKNVQIMDQYLEAEDYLGFVAFCEANYIYGFEEEYEIYHPIITAAIEYNYLYQYIMKLEAASSEQGYSESDFDFLIGHLDSFYEVFHLGELYPYLADTFTEENKAILARMQADVEVLLCTYCGLTEADLEGFAELSQSKRAVLLEERMGYGE